MKVVFQGEQGAYGELAAKEYFGASAAISPLPEFCDVYGAVSAGKARYGVIPIENSLTGSIHQNYDLLLEGKSCIVGEIYLRVSHYLMANKGVSRRRINRILSHPQALAQCKRYLTRFPRIEVVPVSNTAGAVKMIQAGGHADAAAIASMQAAIDYDMKVLARNIEDNHANETRFLILARNQLRTRLGNRKIKTSIVFATKNIPGALFKALSVFALRDIDLFKIESRPVSGRNFEYLFYLDFAGWIRDEAQKNAISHLQEITTFCRVLGSYAVGRHAHPEYRRR